MDIISMRQKPVSKSNSTHRPAAAVGELIIVCGCEGSIDTVTVSVWMVKGGC